MGLLMIAVGVATVAVGVWTLLGWGGIAILAGLAAIAIGFVVSP